MSKALERFIQWEAAGGLLIIVMLFFALILAHSPWFSAYQHFIDLPVQVKVGELDIHKPLLLWINDGLMAVFFLLLALEVKREILCGELSSFKQLSLPLFAAIGGIIVPALIFLIFNHHLSTRVGWPIPITTDIAFVLGVLALLGRWVPTSVKVFIVAYSIVDDILAITIIAIFYTSQLSYHALMMASIGFVVLVLFNILGVKRIAAYIIVGVFIWVAVLKSGVHATLAGVLVGLTIPLKSDTDLEKSPLHHLEHILHPWVAFAILPIFVFANGGVVFSTFKLSHLMIPVAAGIIYGLIIGKSVGSFIFGWLVIRLGLGELPTGATWMKMFAVCMISGIGFTMSLFIASLAFHSSPHENLVRQAILIGSFFACVLGVGLFLCSGKVEESTDKSD